MTPTRFQNLKASILVNAQAGGTLDMAVAQELIDHYEALLAAERERTEWVLAVLEGYRKHHPCPDKRPCGLDEKAAAAIRREGA